MRVWGTRGFRYFAIWVGAMAVITLAFEYARLRRPDLIDVPAPGRLNWWQVLAFATTMTVFGLHLGLAPAVFANDPDPIPRNYGRTLKAKGWIFAVCGVLIALRAIAAILT
jgi:hypothetical protein